MSVKLTGYVFRRIRGRIIPIRKGIDLASKEVSALADKAIGLGKANPKVAGAKPIGAGVDFKVYKAGPSEVLKIPRMSSSRQKISKFVLDRFPFLKNPIDRAVGGAAALPNYGVETVPVTKVRLSAKSAGLVQEKVKPTFSNFIQNEATNLSTSSGIDFDPHIQNISNKGLIDAAIGKLPTKASITSGDYNKWSQIPPRKVAKERGNPAIAKGILEDMAKYAKSEGHTLITERAALETHSKRALNTLKKALNGGSRLKPSATTPGAFELKNVVERIEEAKKRGISFVQKNGKLVPVRGKNGKN